MKRKRLYYFVAVGFILISAYPLLKSMDFGSCLTYAFSGFRDVASDRADRFLGKVQEYTARCRGGQSAAAGQATPWVDWPRYWGAAGRERLVDGIAGKLGFLSPNRRGINGALLDLEYQRIELLKFNLFDNTGTYEEYLRGQSGPAKLAKIWPQFRFPQVHRIYSAVGGDGPQQCTGELVRFRTLTGSCNDVMNPLMGSTDQPFARNVRFEATFPELELNEVSKNRHGRRLGLLTPDPQLISRRVFTRRQSSADNCSNGDALSDDPTEAQCDYKKAAHINMLAAFWIQFMTHDWFSHLDEGRNDSQRIGMGCAARQMANVEQKLTSDEIKKLGCRPEDRIDKSFIARDAPPSTFNVNGETHMSRAPRTSLNRVTAWWDASQIYGYSAVSRRRVKRDLRDPAKLLLESNHAGAEHSVYLPVLQAADPQNPQWAGQEAVAFPDNWNIGLSFFHNVFAREHNLFVDEFRRRAAADPESDCGLRNPANPRRPIKYKEVTADELFEIARLVVSAEIAKIHTLEWTPQMLYNEPVYLAMNANWSGLLKNYPLVNSALEKVVRWFARSESGKRSTEWYSVFAAGPGIVGSGNDKPDINGGVNHFASPFNFPEEFINAYRLHSMVPDLIELRDLNKNPNLVQATMPMVETIRGKATQALHRLGIANWALSMGRQRAGQLTLQNHPRFLQNLAMPRLKSATGKIDVVALDIIRDREHGIPRYNEFRRQYGLKQLTSFDQLIDQRLPVDSPERAEQQRLVALLREIYGQHNCDATKVITDAQKNADGSPINDCLDRPNGTMIDNIEDVDALVGWLAEPVRPHGFAISETQFQIFILNASRRLFSDRFLTSSFRPDFYSHLGVQWINENGADGKKMEKGKPNGHEVEVSPLKRVLLRTIPELKGELDPVVNVFDPWARDRGEYYSLEWKPRRGAESDVSFKQK